MGKHSQILACLLAFISQSLVHLAVGQATERNNDAESTAASISSEDYGEFVSRCNS